MYLHTIPNHIIKKLHIHVQRPQTIQGRVRERERARERGGYVRRANDIVLFMLCLVTNAHLSHHNKQLLQHNISYPLMVNASEYLFTLRHMYTHAPHSSSTYLHVHNVRTQYIYLVWSNSRSFFLSCKALSRPSPPDRPTVSPSCMCVDQISLLSQWCHNNIIMCKQDQRFSVYLLSPVSDSTISLERSP